MTAATLAELATAAETVRLAVTERDKVIRSALAAGHSLRTVGAATGLNHQTVANIRDAADRT